MVGNHYRRPGVAEVKIESHAFSFGDKIMFQGPITGVFPCIAESIEIRNEKVAVALQGKSAAARIDRKVRPGDNAYIIKAVVPGKGKTIRNVGSTVAARGSRKTKQRCCKVYRPLTAYPEGSPPSLQGDNISMISVNSWR